MSRIIKEQNSQVFAYIGRIVTCAKVWLICAWSWPLTFYGKCDPSTFDDESEPPRFDTFPGWLC